MAGIFINDDGKVIGSDGIDDSKVYAMKTTQTKFDSGVPSAGITSAQLKEATKFIQSNTGNSEAFKENNIAYESSVEIEGNNKTRQDMVNIAKNDDGREPANHHEYGATISKDGVVGQVQKGPRNLPGEKVYSHIDLDINADTKSLMHTHQSYEKVEGAEVNPNRVSMNESRTTKNFIQAPSFRDISNATSTNYGFGMRTGKVYIYNGSGVLSVLPLKRFVEFKSK